MNTKNFLATSGTLLQESLLSLNTSGLKSRLFVTNDWYKRPAINKNRRSIGLDCRPHETQYPVFCCFPVRFSA